MFLVLIENFFTSDQDLVYYVFGRKDCVTFLRGTFAMQPYDGTIYVTPYLFQSVRDTSVGEIWKGPGKEVLPASAKTERARWMYLWETGRLAWSKLRLHPAKIARIKTRIYATRQQSARAKAKAEANVIDLTGLEDEWEVSSVTSEEARIVTDHNISEKRRGKMRVTDLNEHQFDPSQQSLNDTCLRIQRTLQRFIEDTADFGDIADYLDAEIFGENFEENRHRFNDLEARDNAHTQLMTIVQVIMTLKDPKCAPRNRALYRLEYDEMERTMERADIVLNFGRYVWWRKKSARWARGFERPHFVDDEDPATARAFTQSKSKSPEPKTSTLKTEEEIQRSAIKHFREVTGYNEAEAEKCLIKHNFNVEDAVLSVFEDGPTSPEAPAVEEEDEEDAELAKALALSLEGVPVDEYFSTVEETPMSAPKQANTQPNTIPLKIRIKMPPGQTVEPQSDDEEEYPDFRPKMVIRGPYRTELSNESKDSSNSGKFKLEDPETEEHLLKLARSKIDLLDMLANPIGKRVEFVDAQGIKRQKIQIPRLGRTRPVTPNEIVIRRELLDKECKKLSRRSRYLTQWQVTTMLKSQNRQWGLVGKPQWTVQEAIKTIEEDINLSSDLRTGGGVLSFGEMRDDPIDLTTSPPAAGVSEPTDMAFTRVDLKDLEDGEVIEGIAIPADDPKEYSLIPSDPVNPRILDHRVDESMEGLAIPADDPEENREIASGTVNPQSLDQRVDEFMDPDDPMMRETIESPTSPSSPASPRKRPSLQVALDVINSKSPKKARTEVSDDAISPTSISPTDTSSTPVFNPQDENRAPPRRSPRTTPRPSPPSLPQIEGGITQPFPPRHQRKVTRLAINRRRKSSTTSAPIPIKRRESVDVPQHSDSIREIRWKERGNSGANFDVLASLREEFAKGGVVIGNDGTGEDEVLGDAVIVTVEKKRGVVVGSFRKDSAMEGRKRSGDGEGPDEKGNGNAGGKEGEEKSGVANTEEKGKRAMKKDEEEKSQAELKEVKQDMEKKDAGNEDQVMRDVAPRDEDDEVFRMDVDTAD